VGASQINVERQQGFSREDAARMDVPLTVTERVGARFKRTIARQSEALFEASFPGTGEPRAPERLAWFSGERSWQMLARARIEHGTRNFSLVVRYETDYGVDAGLKGKIEGVGLKVGGTFQEQKDTVWRLNAEFPPLANSPVPMGQTQVSALAPSDSQGVLAARKERDVMAERSSQ
jgi:hypothetical protein